MAEHDDTRHEPFTPDGTGDESSRPSSGPDGSTAPNNTEDTEDTRAVSGGPAQPYTVYADTDSDTGGPDVADHARPARRVDVVALVAGVIALLVTVLAMTDTLAAGDPRWVLAGAGVLIGGAVLLGSVRRRSAPR